jgi:ribosomal protein S18 acetylase RimI-like enzyme
MKFFGLVAIVLAAKLIGIYSFLIQEYQPVSIGTLSPSKPWHKAKDKRQSTTISMQSSESSSSSFATSNTISYSTRPGTDQDMDLFGMWMDRNREFHSAYNGEPRSSALNFKKGIGLQSLLPNLPNARVLFLLRNGDPNPVGFCSFNIQYSGLGTPPFLYLQDIFIGESCRGTGAGRFLMTELQSIAKQSYCSHMTWNADRRNQPALDFYQGLGAETIGSTNNWIHMRLSL